MKKMEYKSNKTKNDVYMLLKAKWKRSKMCFLKQY